ncbi:MAG TPA: tRNA (guanosine(37)-N1)-methyltransferase TrmD, partial [Caldisericia bacterium]|nr:tRNA (guanosine(37)-N1)-methyltransferase TrmD [Caldisericia bacterium]
MRFIVITIFPEIFKIYFETGLPKKSIDKGLINYELINLRDFSSDKHKKVDDYTYGGGTGMVFMFPVLKKAVEKAKELSNNNHIILLSPSGIKYDQNL